MSLGVAEWQFKLFETYYGDDGQSKLKEKVARKEKQKKKESLAESVKKDKKNQLKVYKDNLKTVKSKSRKGLVDKQKQLLNLLQENKKK